MGNHRIITDEKILKEFIEWLPEEQFGEQYYIALFARKKYAPQMTNVRSDKDQLKRFTATKDRLYDKLRQLESPIGSYVQKGIIAPQESLAVYISLNPRSLEKATYETLKTLVDLVSRPYGGYNPQAQAMSAIQKSVSRKIYFDMDFDAPFEVASMLMEEWIKAKINQIIYEINREAITVLRTRGGFHLIIETSKIAPEYQKTWYNGIHSVDGVDVRGDTLIPVPGCTQGGFSPYFMDLNKLLT